MNIKKGDIKMTKIIFYGGVSEIGGNKILIKDRGTSVMFDWGYSFKIGKRYGLGYLTLSEQMVKRLNIFPNIKGIYKSDSISKKVCGLNVNVPIKSNLDGICLSHAHLDHASYLTLLKPSIPIYSSSLTKKILEIRSTLHRRTLLWRVENSLLKGQDSYFKIDNIKIEPIKVDHSIIGAVGFLIETSNGNIAYTGDFRLHGFYPEQTRNFWKKVYEFEPKIVITEVTNMLNSSSVSEMEAERELLEICSITEGLILLDISTLNYGKFLSLQRIAKKTNRKLVLSAKDMFILGKLEQYFNIDYSNIYYWLKDIPCSKWEKEVSSKFPNKAKTLSSLNKIQKEIILDFSSFDLRHLNILNPSAGSSYIRLSTEPWNEEGQLFLSKHKNWLGVFGLTEYQVHVSGHIMPFELKTFLNKLKKNTTIFPIHTGRPETFQKFMRGSDNNIILPKKGKSYQV